MNVHLAVPPTTIGRARVAAPPGRAVGFAALCLGIALLLAIKYYPLKPTLFVLSQYLWTVDVGDYRRAVVSSLAALAHGHDPARFLPVVDLVSLVEMAGLALALAWGAARLAGRPVPRLGLLLLLCSGAVPHLLATRGSQDGFAALALIGLAAALGARRTGAAALLGALAAAVHEASVVYVASICALHVLLTDIEPDAGPRAIPGRLRGPGLLPPVAAFGAAAIAAVAAIAATHLTPDQVAEICRRHDWIAAVGDTAVLRDVEPGTALERWTEVCGLQFRAFSGSPGFVLRSVALGSLFAPLALVTLALALRARLSPALRCGVAAALLLPALLPFVATDVTRFWSYMNLTALYGLTLLVPHLRGFGRLSPGGLLTGVLALWAVVAVGIDQWPTGWPRPPSALPDAVALRLPTFRDALCAASRRGLCDKPVTVFR